MVVNKTSQKQYPTNLTEKQWQVMEKTVNTQEKKRKLTQNEYQDDSATHPDDSSIKDFETVLRDIFTKLFDKNEPFTKTEDINHCIYCDFKTICNMQEVESLTFVIVAFF